MSIPDNLTRILTAKDNLRAAIQAKGVTVPEDALIDSYPDYVDEIQQGSSPALESKTYTPTETAADITPSAGYDGLSSVHVNAISTTYVGSGITRRSSSDLSASGANVSVPSGFYQQNASKSVQTGTEGTPSISAGSVTSNSITLTPIVTNGAGYINGGNKSGNSVTVTAAQLVSGTKPINANGTGIDVTNYKYVDVAVPGGSSKNVQIAAGVDRVNVTSYTAVPGQSITVAKTGKYDVYWTGFRSSTGGTNGSALYIDGSAHSSDVQTTFTNHGQSIHISNVSLTKDQVVTVRARARGTSYYMYVGNLTIIEQ